MFDKIWWSSENWKWDIKAGHGTGRWYLKNGFNDFLQICYTKSRLDVLSRALVGLYRKIDRGRQ